MPRLADQRTRPRPIALGAALVGAALLVVSPFLMWGQVDILIGTVSQTGMDAGSGWVHLVAGLAVAALGGAWVLGAPKRLVQLGWLVLGIVAGAFVLYELSRVHDCAFFISEVDECVATPSYGPGLFVALAGALATLAGAGLTLLNRRAAA